MSEYLRHIDRSLEVTQNLLIKFMLNLLMRHKDSLINGVMLRKVGEDLCKRQVILLEDFKNSVNANLKQHVDERRPNSLNEEATFADEYSLIQFIVQFNLIKR